MLSPPDADLVRRDPALPGLGTVLDPARFVAALRAARPELGIEAVQVGYVHYKPGRECIVGYRLARRARARLLRDLLPGRPDLRAGPVGTLAYKPQRRYVGRLLGPDGPLVLKVCAAKDYAATVATAGALGSRGPLRIPRVLGCSDQHRV